MINWVNEAEKAKNRVPTEQINEELTEKVH